MTPRLSRSSAWGRAAILVLVLVAAGVGGAIARLVPLAGLAQADTKKPTHRILFHVATDEPAAMSHAISAADNAMKFYRAKGEAVAIEIVANGAGVRMMRADLSPLAPSFAYLHATYPAIVLNACGTTLRLMREKDGREPPLLPGITVTPAGIARIVELQEQGWSYVRS